VESNPSIVRNADGGLRLGVVIQAYLRDSASDVRDLIQWARSRNLRVPIRLVKGAYMDHERALASKQERPDPIWGNKQATDANFEAVSACLLLNLDAVVPAFATHNIRSQAHAMALAEAYGLPTETARIQMLYGMGDQIKHIIVAMGRSLREYVPAGSFARGLKYSGRRFDELASSDNALARTMRGDFSGEDGSAPTFSGKKNIEDSRVVRAFLEQSLARHSKD
jgi:RHH-type proline utilization regulon transcriptional repressor/proline dehydrogenase/delta 1-pyrroline-5-carboxylate dehydrogenase